MHSGVSNIFSNKKEKKLFFVGLIKKKHQLAVPILYIDNGLSIHPF